MAKKKKSPKYDEGAIKQLIGEINEIVAPEMPLDENAEVDDIIPDIVEEMNDSSFDPEDDFTDESKALLDKIAQDNDLDPIFEVDDDDEDEDEEDEETNEEEDEDLDEDEDDDDEDDDDEDEDEEDDDDEDLDEDDDDEDDDDEDEDEEDDEEDEEEPEPPKKKKKKAAKKKGKKAPAPAKRKAAKKSSGKPGVIQTILETLVEHGPITHLGIVGKLKKVFPERNENSMMGTVRVQVPNRIRNERKLDVRRDKSGAYYIHGTEQEKKADLAPRDKKAEKKAKKAKKSAKKTKTEKKSGKKAAAKKSTSKKKDVKDTKKSAKKTTKKKETKKKAAKKK